MSEEIVISQIANAMNTPQVSILIAARNEEKVIGELLLSLENLSYPKDKMDVWVGNDASIDNTLQIVSDFAKDKNWIQVVDIQDGNVGDLKGKARVLAILAQKAKGDYLFFTDADIEVPTHWIEEMLNEFSDEKVGVVVGNTTVKYSNWFEACQAIEWLMGLFAMHNFAKFGIETSGMGNNMAVSTAAYKAVGGYETIPFSIVEDYAIYRAILDAGFGYKHPFRKEILAFTKPPENYFHQRKRWVTGGMQTKSMLILPAFLQAFAFPVLLILGYLHWPSGLLLLNLIFLINLILGFSFLKKMGQQALIAYLPIYTLYMLVFWFAQFLNYFIPTKLVWKGRNYL